MIEKKIFKNKIKDIYEHAHNLTIERACNKLLELDIPGVYEYGINRSRIQYEFFNQYPSSYVLKPLEGKKIFKEQRSLYEGEKSPTLALYVHLPFCKEKCTYCCCHTSTEWTYEFIDKYIDYLEREMTLLVALNPLQDISISSVYIGGGTPTLLLPKQIKRICSLLRSLFNVTEATHWTTEATPDSLSNEMAESLRTYGFGRLNIGVQTCDNALLSKTKRKYRSDDLKKYYELCLNAGLQNVNIDLIFGLAQQSLESWSRTLQCIHNIAPANITCYPFANSCSGVAMALQPEETFPTEIEKLLMHIMAIDTSTQHGYTQITPYQFISSWDYPYVQQEHKALNGAIHAFGITGHSFYNGCEYHNTDSFMQYFEHLDKGILPVSKGRILDKKEMMTRFIIYSLQKTSGVNRKGGGLSLGEFEKRFSICAYDEFGATFEKLIKANLLRNNGEEISLTYQGLLYPVETCKEFYSSSDKKILDELSREMDL